MKILLAILILVSTVFADYTYIKPNVDGVAVYKFDTGLIMYETKKGCSIKREWTKVINDEQFILEIEYISCKHKPVKVTYDENNNISSIEIIIDGKFKKLQ